ncbi:hypothetical protein ACFFQW_42700 [Umezawaea endophytica]|uniref:PE family protein n=1 Tax=Umezawaea endophytica TaxID=1654476 RepID=A0A9X3AII7_9PSEU|nr:hypothetical protein [Umezawaea endophytica]MCS7482566.1 hypothetical protein [Umezawaea endophytica]
MALIGFDAITAVGAGAAAGAAIGAGLGTGGGSAKTAMQVDLDEAPKLIAGLEAAIEKLTDAYQESYTIASAKSPGQDPYSGVATEAIRQSAGGEQGGYGWANKKAREALTETIANIKTSMQNYSQTDGAAHDSFKPEG